MSLKQLYQNYLAAPTAAALSENATLSYITTLTTIHTAAAIVKHNTAQQKVLKKKEEKVLDYVQGANGITLDVETTLEFVSGGGAYTPGLDDNFLADRTVVFPMVHIVHFDVQNKIQQIRLYWDQGSLLKQVDVIGARARMWPIRDGKDQARLIATSAAGITANGAAATAPFSSTPATAPTTKPRAQSRTATKDPHASLSLFASREELDAADKKAIAPRATTSARPPTRGLEELFGGDEEETSSRGRGAAGSPKKENGSMLPPPPKSQTSRPPTRNMQDIFGENESDNSPITKGGVKSPEKSSILSPGSVAPKIGAGKNYKPIRLFDTEEEDPSTPRSPDKSAYKAHPGKYNHFDFGHGEDEAIDQTPRPRTKHQSQWDFEDFVTPVKAPIKARPQDQPSFGWEAQEPANAAPAKAPAGAKGRPDQNPHFEFQDDGTPAGSRRPAGNPRGAGQVRTQGLYEDHVFNNDRSPSPEKSKPLAPVTNLQDRRKDFDPHFSMTDVPAGDKGKEPSKPVPEARKKVVSQMGASWEVADESPNVQSQHSRGSSHNPITDNKENVSLGIKSGGDGMGGKKGTSRQWGFGDDSDPEEDDESKFRASKKQQAPRDNNIWDF